MKPNISKRLQFMALLIGLCVSTIQAQDLDKDKDTSTSNVIRRSGDVLQQEATNRVEPAYPPLARAAKISGLVLIEVTIDEHGDVSSARIISGHPLLRDSALEAARKWKFKPATLSGKPVKVIGNLSFNFALQGVKQNDGEEGREKSIEVLEAQLKENPTSGEAHYNLGVAYLKAGRLTEAIASLKEANRINSKSAATYYQLGLAYMRSNRLEEAGESFREALKVDPDHWNNDATYMGLGLVYFRQEKYEEAVHAFQESIKISPFIADTYVGLGVAQSMLGRYQEALQPLKRAVELNSNIPGGHYYLGIAYAMLGDKNRL